MKISEITRRDILDALLVSVEGDQIYGRLEELEFLSRVWDLEAMPSTDARFDNAHGDIWQHTVNNYDWSDDWVFSDPRFELSRGDDSVFLRFLSELVHPVVRPDAVEREQLVQLFNNYLQNDGFSLVERARISGKPIYAGRYTGTGTLPGVNAVKETLEELDISYVTRQITRMEAAVLDDPDLAIGTAKELVETCCKTILKQNQQADNFDSLPKLMKATTKCLELTPQDIHEKAKAAETIKRLLSNLATITQGIAELRNLYGTGHGRDGSSKGLQARHAKLAVGAASTLAVFLVETSQERETRRK